MNLYGKYKAGRKYKYGEIKVTDDLEEKLVREVKVSIKPVKDEQEFIDKEVLDRFMVDVDKIGPLFIDHGNDTLTPYITNGDLDVYKVYYLGKDLNKCFFCQDKALVCLDYIAYGYPEYRDFAYGYIEEYLDLRHKQDADLDKLVRKAKSKKMVSVEYSI